MNAIHKCKTDGHIVFDANCYRLMEGVTAHIWCVYDRDMEHQEWDQIKEQDHLDFDLSIQTALQAGLKVAWSNDAFELWVLLHFEDVSAQDILHRDFIYERLTEIFKIIEPRTAELDTITSNARFNYKTSFKKRDHFLNHILPLLKANVGEAIRRAAALEKQFDDAIPFHLRNPCTLVHHLVRDILEL